VGQSQDDIGDALGIFPCCWNSFGKMKPLGGGSEVTEKLNRLRLFADVAALLEQSDQDEALRWVRAKRTLVMAWAGCRVAGTLSSR
jgi:hypothetical protein